MSLLDRIFRSRREKPVEEARFEREERPDGTLSLTTRDLEHKGTLDLRIDGVPPPIEHAVLDLLERLAAVAERDHVLTDGETLGGPLADQAQPVIHMATVRLASRSTAPGSGDIFRVVDYGEDVAAGFPARLLATHLAVWHPQGARLRERIDLLAWSVRIFPGGPPPDDGRFAFDRGENLGNWAGWNALGELLVEAGQTDRGIECLRTAAAHCPAWADEFAQHVRESVTRAGADPAEDPRLRFWWDLGKKLKS